MGRLPHKDARARLGRLAAAADRFIPFRVCFQLELRPHCICRLGPLSPSSRRTLAHLVLSGRRFPPLLPERCRVITDCARLAVMSPSAPAAAVKWVRRVPCLDRAARCGCRCGGFGTTSSPVGTRRQAAAGKAGARRTLAAARGSTSSPLQEPVLGAAPEGWTEALAGRVLFALCKTRWFNIWH